MSESAFARVASRIGGRPPGAQRPNLHVVPDDGEPAPAANNVSTHRPVRFAEIIGQPRLTMRLEVHLASSLARDAQPGHVLLDGGPGLGKTTIAQAIAVELTERGVPSRCHEITAETIGSVKKMVIELAQLTAGDVLFIDEVQELKRPVQVALYKALEDGYMIVEGGSKDAAQRFDLPPVTVVAATTAPGKLSAPLRDRFKLTGHLEPYNFDDLQLLLMAHAERAELDLAFEAAEAIARASRYTPRRAIRLLEAVRGYAYAVTGELGAKVDEETATQGLEFAGVDRYGLEDRDRRVLRALAEDFMGGPIGLAPMASTLGMDHTELEKDVEPYLLRAGLMRRLPRGRAATRATYVVLGMRVPPLVNGLVQ